MKSRNYKNLKVSIILPNYNSSDYIKSTIKSIFDQTFKNWELILVDDNSNQKTKKILNLFKKNKKIKIYQLKKNKGAGYCRNLAIKKSKYKYLAYIDSDDVWKKNKLKKHLNFMYKNNYQFSYTNYKTFLNKEKKLNKVNVPDSFTFEKFTKNTSIATSTMIVKKKVLKGIRFTDSKICEDYYFKCKILKKIGTAYLLNEYLTNYRIREGSLQSNKLRNFTWIWKINSKYNKFNIFKNFISLFFISINSLIKYGFK